MLKLVAIFCVFAQVAFGQDEVDSSLATTANPVVVTPMGAIKGSWMSTRKGRKIEGYRGIRYAEAPTLDLRFQPPKPIESYTEQVDATKDGPACPQPIFLGYPMDEDCLRLNVYTPSHNSSKLPVIVYIHSGAFGGLSGRSDLAGPENLLDRDVVLVTINYRVGVLGYIATGDALAPGNNGYKDQVAALKWVNKNIEAFGGNPKRVTLTGCSAGSMSVMLHMISPMSKGLFHRAISLSGGVTGKAPLATDLRKQTLKQAQIFGCPTNTSKAIIDCLKTKPWKDIGDSLLQMFEFSFDPAVIWEPIVEPDFGQERFLPMEPMEAIRQRKIHAVPYIISLTKNEMFYKAFPILQNSTLLARMNNEWEKIAPISFELPEEAVKRDPSPSQRLKDAFIKEWPMKNDAISAEGLGVLYADSIIGFATHRMANLMAKYSKKKVYYCQFEYIGERSFYEDPVTKKPTGVAHHDDLLYLFGYTSRFPIINTTSPDSAMVDRMTAIWYNFAEHGNPNKRLKNLPEISDLSWPVMKPADRKYLSIGKEFSINSNMFEDRFKVWEEIYPLPWGNETTDEELSESEAVDQEDEEEDDSEEEDESEEVDEDISELSEDL